MQELVGGGLQIYRKGEITEFWIITQPCDNNEKCLSMRETWPDFYF